MSIIDGSAEYSLQTIPSFNDLGYYQPNTTYNIGDIVFHKNLPAGYYLECNVGGTTGNTINPNNSIGEITNDGTVTWITKNINYNLNEIKWVADLNSAIYQGIYRFSSNSQNHPPHNSGGKIVVFTSNCPFENGATNTNVIWQIAFFNTNSYVYIRFNHNNENWTSWKRFTTSNEIFPKYDNAAAHNSIYRGKDLTSYFNSGEMSTAIANGTFEDIYPGDYIIKSVTIDGTTYSNVKFIVMDLDYHLNSGNIQTTTHHVVVMPEGHLGTAQMNETRTTEGGYQGSKMWTTTIPLVNAGIKAAFGDSHILSHNELLTKMIDATATSGGNSTWQGCSVDWSWTNVEANICNEQQVYGTRVFGSSAFDIGDCYNQFAAFRLSKALQSKDRHWFWLRTVVSNSQFCFAASNGSCDYAYASDSSGVRPYFLLV